jgi:hypothetical protein
MHVFYAADVNQLAARSEDMDNEGPEKAKRRKKSKLVWLYICLLIKVVLKYQLNVLHKYLYFWGMSIY